MHSLKLAWTVLYLRQEVWRANVLNFQWSFLLALKAAQFFLSLKNSDIVILLGFLPLIYKALVEGVHHSHLIYVHQVAKSQQMQREIHLWMCSFLRMTAQKPVLTSYLSGCESATCRLLTCIMGLIEAMIYVICSGREGRHRELCFRR